MKKAIVALLVSMTVANLTMGSALAATPRVTHNKPLIDIGDFGIDVCFRIPFVGQVCV
ncbi:hypothetical protein ACFO1V_04670 [Daeguia caeni]|uniref:Uncharacterized protein n=1 Tax=Daeguia caeni TaxID=439612 RepID=A0ABV9H263_9HYPH